MKTGHIRIRTKQHVTSIPISAEDYLRDEVLKDNEQQTDNKLNELTDKLTKTCNDEQTNKMEKERKDTEPKMIQSAENMGMEHNERPPQFTANKAIKQWTEVNSMIKWKAREHCHDEIRTDQEKTRQTMLPLGH